MKLSKKEFLDYVKCPALYDMKYNKKITPYKDKTLTDYVDEAVKAHMTRVAIGVKSDGDMVKRDWDKICKSNEGDIDSKKALKGIGMIMNMLHWLRYNDVNVKLFGSQYSINTRTCSLVGDIGIVSENSGGNIELIVTNMSGRNLDKEMIDIDIRYTIDCYGFKSISGKEIERVRIFNAHNSTEDLTTRGQTSFDRLEASIEGASRAISGNIYYISEDYTCPRCEAFYICRMWK